MNKPTTSPVNKKSKKIHTFKAFALALSATVLSFFLVFCFMMYGPIDYFRNLWVNTAMETMTHQWLASVFFDTGTIHSIMDKSVVVLKFKTTDPSLIDTASSSGSSKYPKDNATTLPTKPEDGERIINGVGFIKLRGSYGNGWVIKVYDPSRVTLGISNDFGTHGELISQMVPRLGAFVGINAGGFEDPGGHGNGGMPDQILIYNGKEIRGPSSAGPHHIIGITYDHKLVLGEYTNAELLKQNFQYGVEFWPFIIMNGKPLDEGYNSLNPRTAIGQTKDGTFIFVVIDGRSISSRGATMKDVQKIMTANGAYNAANLDGGSSTVFVYNGKVINVPSTPIGERYVPDAFLVN
jgi:exopolysaccharide biosynthesis protein